MPEKTVAPNETALAQVQQQVAHLSQSLNELVITKGGLGGPVFNPISLPPLSAALQKLVSDGLSVPVLDAKGSLRQDGRRVPLVFVVVRDKDGRTRPGLPVHLYVGGEIVDRGTTSGSGLVLLRFPRRAQDDSADATGDVEVLGLVASPTTVTVPGDRQHIVHEVILDRLPDVVSQLDLKAISSAVRDAVAHAATPVTDNLPSGPPAAPDGAALGDVAAKTVAQALTQQLAGLNGGLAGDVFGRLPSDFETSVCAALETLTDEANQLLNSRAGTGLGTLLGIASAVPSPFGKPVTAVRHLSITRIGTPDGTFNPKGVDPGRYVVRVRQRWVFAGYSLGELAQLQPLDPGSLLREVTANLQRTVSTATQATDEAVNRSTSQVLAGLAQIAKVDNVVNLATTSEITAMATGTVGAHASPVGSIVGGIIGGFVAGPLGIVAGGLIGGLASGAGVDASVGTPKASVSTASRVATNLETSLQVNQLTQTAASVVNEVARTASTALNEVQRTAQSALDQVSPLLSRVTNLLRWTIYENYVVCTEVEDVLKIVDVPLVDGLGTPGARAFSAADVVELRRIFEPVLLEPALRRNFDNLRDLLQSPAPEARPIQRISVRVDAVSVLFSSVVRVDFGGFEIALQFSPDTTTAFGSVSIPPTRANDLADATLWLSAINPVSDGDSDGLFKILGISPASPSASVIVNRVEIWFDRSPAAVPDQIEKPDLGIDRMRTPLAVSAKIVLKPLTLPAVNPEADPLVVHVNRNLSHYMGALAQAALADPALRDDVPQLAAFGSANAQGADAALWRLPIVGFEGGRALVLVPAADDPVASRFLDEAAAGTLVQLAAPGSYGEALQGLLGLVDADKLLHPSLLAPPPPLLTPAALVDTLNHQLVPLTGGLIKLPGTQGSVANGAILGGSGLPPV